MICVLLKDCQVHQLIAINLAQGVKIHKLLAEEEFQKFPETKSQIKLSITSCIRSAYL